MISPLQLKYATATKKLAESIGLEAACEAVAYVLQVAEAESFRDKMGSMTVFICAVRFGIQAEDILLKGGCKEVSRLRSALYYLFMQTLGFSARETAKIFNTSHKRVLAKKSEYIMYRSRNIDPQLVAFEITQTQLINGLERLFNPIL